VFAGGDFFLRIPLSNVADGVDESKEANDFVFDNNINNDDTNTDF